MENQMIEDKIREALMAEIERQLGQKPQTDREGPVRVSVNGVLNLDDLSAAVTGALAGGP
jgi:hypothetical protein